jgi:F-type H+-transporting ATPase subunit b
MKAQRLTRIFFALTFCVLMATVLFASEGGGEGGGKNELVNFGWRMLNFVILVGLLWYWLADKIRTFFGERRSEIASLLDEVAKAREDANKQFAVYEQKFKNIEKDTQEIRDMFVSEIESEKKRIAAEGQNASERIMEQAKAAADQEVIKARQGLRDYVVDLAGDMALKIVTKGMQPKDQAVIIDEYLDKVVREK